MNLSITWRARLLNGLLSATVLVTLSSLAGHQIRGVLYSSVDRALKSQAQGWGKQGFREPPPKPPNDGFHDEHKGFGGGPRLRKEPPRLDFGTTSLLPPRRLSFEGKTQEQNPPWSQEGFLAAKQSGEDLREALSPQGERLHVYSLRTQNRVIQTAATLAETEAALQEIQRALNWLLLPLALGSAILGALLTDLALAPVRQLTRVAAALDTTNLSARLPSPGGSDSFDQLVTVLNGMLGRIEAAFARQKRFTADASHELRTPLAVIKAAASFLVEQPDGLTGMERRSVVRIDKTADRANRLITDLLLLARSESEHLPVALTRTEVSPLLTAAIQDAQTAHGPETQAHVELVCPADLHQTLDPNLIHRLVSNLVSNALRHTPPDGKITLTATANGFTLTDTGEGIAPDILPRLGEPFYRPDESRARTHGGAGLGLAICKSIVAAHHGSLRIASELGKGTSVIVTIPLAPLPLPS